MPSPRNTGPLCSLADAGEARAYFGSTTLDRVIDKVLMLFLLLSEAFYPGLGADGILTSLQHFYDEYRLRHKMMRRVWKKAMFDGYERKRLRKEASSFRKLRSKCTKLTEK
jgi:hypothetical protein